MREKTVFINKQNIVKENQVFSPFLEFTEMADFILFFWFNRERRFIN